MSLAINGGTFYLATIRDAQTLHANREDAINQLRSADGLDTETDNVSIVEVSVTDGDWQIAELPWQNIALELLRGEGQ